jgi:serine/threonine-protein kinase RsbW
MTHEHQSLTVSGDVANLETIADFVTTAAHKANLDEQDVFAVQLAVDEACTNVIEHAYADMSGDIHLTCEIKPGECIIAIRDNGRPFDPQAVPPPDLDGDLEDRRVGGLGLYFIKKLMDEVRFSFDPDEGNQVVMIKKASRSNQGEMDKTFAVVAVQGRLDAASAPALEAQLETHLAQDDVQIVVDMAQVSYIASSGLKVLLAALRQARQRQGQLVLCNIQPKVASILEMIGFDQVFPIAQDLETASRLLEPS